MGLGLGGAVGRSREDARGGKHVCDKRVGLVCSLGVMLQKNCPRNTDMKTDDGYTLQ